MSSSTITDIRQSGITMFSPLSFQDVVKSNGPNSSSNHEKKSQDREFDVERSSPFHYTASMPDFQAFSISEDKKHKTSCCPRVDINTFENRRNARSPLSFNNLGGLSSEAPARLNSPQRFLKPYRQRAVSLSILEGSSESFVTLESTSTNLFDLPSLVSRADAGLKYGVDPTLAEGAMGGTYFLRDRARLITVVCKPGDEEPNSPYNPYQEQNGAWGSAYKGRIIPGFGMYREVAAFVLDDGFAGVPPTALAKVRHRFLRNETAADTSSESISSSLGAIDVDYIGQNQNQNRNIDSVRNIDSMGNILPNQIVTTENHQSLKSESDAHTEGEEDENFYGGYKLSSVQSYVRHEGCAEDLGPSMFDEDDIVRIAVLDIRLCNLDRHGGNILVCQHQPYVNSKHGVHPLNASLSSVCLFGCTETLPIPLNDDEVDDDEEREEENERELRDSWGGHRGAAVHTSSTHSTARLVPSHSFPPSHMTCPNSTHPPSSSSCDRDWSASSVASSAPMMSTSLQIFFDRQMTSRENTTPSPPVNRPPRFPVKSRLVPIDHGYCLPHVLHMSDTAFIWLNWSQAKAPVPEHVRQYIASLDYKADVELLRRTVGAAIPETSLLTLRVCTLMLQLGVAAGLSLYDIGTAMSPSSPDQPSPLHAAVKHAVQVVVHWNRQMGMGSHTHGLHRQNIRNPRPIHNLSSSSPSASTSTPTSSAVPPFPSASYLSPQISPNCPSSHFFPAISSSSSIELGCPFNHSMSMSMCLSKSNHGEGVTGEDGAGTIAIDKGPVCDERNNTDRGSQIPSPVPISHPQPKARSVLFVPKSRSSHDGVMRIGVEHENDDPNRLGGRNRDREGGGGDVGVGDMGSTSSSGSSSGTCDEEGEEEEETNYGEVENTYLQRGKSCPIPQSPSPRGQGWTHGHALNGLGRGMRFSFSKSSSRDYGGIASHSRNSASNMMNPNSIIVNDETLTQALSVHGGKLLVEELEKAVTVLVEQIRLTK